MCNAFWIKLLTEWIVKIISPLKEQRTGITSLATQILVSETPQQCCLAVQLSNYVGFSYNSNGSC